MTDPSPIEAHPPVVLIHGVGLDQTMWEPIAALLSTDRRVSTYNMIGHADASKPSGPYSLSMFIDQLSSVVDLMNAAGPVDVVGFSMGALVAQGFAITHPDRVRRLALLHSVFDRTEDERAAIVERLTDVRNGGFAATISAAINRWFTPTFAAEHADVVDRVRRVLEANDVEAYANAYEVFATADGPLVEQTSSIGCETLVITGADDQRSTPLMTRRLADTVQRGEAVVLPVLRHLAPLEDPASVAELLSSFFNR